MKDRNGVELKPGDRVKLEYETEVLRGYGCHPLIRSSLGGEAVVSEAVLTKVVPEFEWTESIDRDDNSSFSLILRGSKVMRIIGGDDTKVGMVVYSFMRKNRVLWGRMWSDDSYDTLEEAKAAAEKAVKP